MEHDLKTAIDLYWAAMKGSPEPDLFKGMCVVRLWDGMDGCWCDVTAAVTPEEALRVWNERTERGTKKVSFDEIDYFRIFPATTKMVWSGDREMFR